MIEVETTDGIAAIRLAKSVTNPIDLELVAALHGVLREVREDPSIRGVVLGSANEKFLSIGFDIPNLFPLAREEFREFFRAFNRFFLDLYSLPKPVVAALTGHAIAGGCVLALGADDRVAAEGRKLIGLNEVKLGVPVPFAADCVVRSILSPRHAKAVLVEGEFHESAAAFSMGLVDEVRPLDEVWGAATERAARLGATAGGAFRIIKANRIDPVLAEVRARRTEREESFLDSWFAPDTREQLKAAIENF